MSIDKLKTKFFTGAWLTDVKHYFTKINEIIDYLNGNGSSGDGSYKSYVVLLNQSGTNAPVPKILQNNLGGTPTFSYLSTGRYHCLANDAIFPIDKTCVFVTGSFNLHQIVINTILGVNSDIEFAVYDLSTDSLQDDVMYDVSFEVRVYN